MGTREWATVATATILCTYLSGSQVRGHTRFAGEFFSLVHPADWNAREVRPGVVAVARADASESITITRRALDGRTPAADAHTQSLAHVYGKPWAGCHSPGPCEFPAMESLGAGLATAFDCADGSRVVVATFCCKSGAATAIEYEVRAGRVASIAVLDAVVRSVRHGSAKMLPGRYAQHETLTFLSDGRVIREWMDGAKWESRQGSYVVEADKVVMRWDRSSDTCVFDVSDMDLELNCGGHRIRLNREAK